MLPVISEVLSYLEATPTSQKKGCATKKPTSRLTGGKAISAHRQYASDPLRFFQSREKCPSEQSLLAHGGFWGIIGYLPYGTTIVRRACNPFSASCVSIKVIDMETIRELLREDPLARATTEVMRTEVMYVFSRHLPKDINDTYPMRLGAPSNSVPICNRTTLTRDMRYAICDTRYAIRDMRYAIRYSSASTITRSPSAKVALSDLSGFTLTP